MGCPDRGVEKSGGGAALIKDPARAKEIIRALKHGTGDNGGGLPISVKTRLGYSKTTELEPWLAALLEEQPAALTVHLRTRAEMSDVPAHWELAPQIVALRDKISPKTVLLGNGNVRSLEDAHARTKESGVDGVMVGAGVFGNPWFFSGRTQGTKERLERLVIHTKLFEKLYRSDNLKPISQGGRIKNFEIMKKHYKSYTPGEKELRMRLMEAENASEVGQIVQDFLKKS
jgi:tRNA-dihydrouridine synthase